MDMVSKKMQSLCQSLDETIKNTNGQAVRDAIEYLLLLQGKCSVYSRLLTDAGIEHEPCEEDSTIVDTCARLTSVRHIVEGYCVED